MKQLINNLFFFSFLTLYGIKALSKVTGCDNFDILQKTKHTNSSLHLEKNKLYIYSDSINIEFPNKFFFIGNAKIYQNKSLFFAKKFKIINEKQRTLIFATDDVKYIFNSDFYITGVKAFFVKQTGDLDFYKINYHFFNDNIFGNATLFKIRNDNKLVLLKNGSISICKYKCYLWKISGSKIIYNRIKKTIKIWNPKIYFKKFPVFYFPYLKINLNNNFNHFVPSINYNNKSGFSILFSYQSNLFKNYYFYIFPKYTTNHGFEFNNKLFYTNNLNKQQYVNFRWLKSKKNNDYIWFFRWNYEESLNNNININAHYLNSNNLFYFINTFELNKKNFIENDIVTQLKLNFSNKNWKIESAYRKFYVYTADKGAYNTSPYLYFKYNVNDKNMYLNFQLFGELTQFQIKKDLFSKITRTHIEPTFFNTFFYSGISFNNEIKLIIMNYYEYNYNNTFLKKVNKYAPQFKTNIHLLKNIIINYKSYFQSMQLKFQYVYMPYHKKNDMKLKYVPCMLNIDYFNISNNICYNYLNPFSHSNKATLEWKTYIYDNKYIERFNMSFKKILNFEPSYTKKFRHKYPNFFGIANWKINKYLKLNSAFQLDQINKRFLKFDTQIIYQKNYYSYFLGYRFLSQYWINYFQLNQKIQNNIYEIQFSGKFLLKNRFFILASNSYNLNPIKYLKNTFNIEYNASCFTYKLQYEQKINFQKNDYKKIEQSIFLNIGLKQSNDVYLQKIELKNNINVN
ncbi:organic solvent tolerance protein [Wigglesworthia glossinidia endosymbiont of Glossina morsitans morsitans (Yale colony)]|uniref:Organic solvent tolerance protein n=1 Tax=Wigglesworthia glossinidia endosymbiont of Glossina morsitans morsitans (Yale colony) TaxID=1142511 RepID=H6Q498_WIGGL|nr:LPS assembly protein LptD [Wigglesworthia glossinidia]AFA40881.1 organic solvent tolerance protein [Wigglesworthia glossinidia endosymbiont of Glossina morsitans morsitans (Yale colony)]